MKCCQLFTMPPPLQWSQHCHFHFSVQLRHYRSTHRHLWWQFSLTQRTVLFWIFLSNTKKNEGEMGRKKVSHAAKSFLSRNDSAIFHLNTNIYTKISPSHYAEITLISAGKIKSHWSIMKAARAGQLLCRSHGTALLLSPVLLWIKSDQKKRVWKSGGEGGVIIPGLKPEFCCQLSARSNFLQLSYKTGKKKRGWERERGGRQRGLQWKHKQAWPLLHQC